MKVELLRDRLLLVVLGFPGTGKSEVAKRLNQELRGVRLNSDEVRKRLFPHSTYSREESAVTYEQLFALGARGLALGWPVILDATFNLVSGRTRAIELARSSEAKLSFVHVTCEDEESIRSRLELRTNTGNPSDVDYAIYRLIRDHFGPITVPHTRFINNDGMETLNQRVHQLMENLVFVQPPTPCSKTSNEIK